MNNTKTKILVISEPGTDGVKNHVVSLLKYINLDFFEVDYIYSTYRSDSVYLDQISQLKRRGINCINIEMRPQISLFDVISFMLVLKYSLKQKYDVVHAHSSKAGFIGRLVGKILSIPVKVYTPNAFAFQTGIYHKKILFILLEKIASYWTDILICVSKTEKEVALKYNIISQSKIALIPNGVDTDNFNIIDISHKKQISMELLNNQDRLTIGTVGRMSYQKNPLLFYESLSVLFKNKKIRNKIKIVHVGTGELANIVNEYIIQNKLIDVVNIIGYTSNVKQFYGMFDIFVLTSRYEGLPISLLEAMSCGCACVGTDVNGISDMIIHGYNGYLTRQCKFSIAETFELLCMNDNIRISCGNNARKFVCENYDMKHVVDKLQMLYRTGHIYTD